MVFDNFQKKNLMHNPNFKFFILSFSLIFLIVGASCKKKLPASVLTNTDTTTTKDTTSNPTSSPTSRFNITMDNLIGSNGFHEDSVKNMKAVGLLRAYCDWDWFQGDNPYDTMVFEYSRGGWYFDEAFKKIKDSGILVDMCFNGAIKNLQGTNNFKFDDKPIDAPGLSTTDPNSYHAISSALFQMAARYGKTKVPDNLLNVARNQKASGLDLIQFMEVWNEPDKTWMGANAQFAPEEYAAMLSACYDSIKKADPNMKVVMAGIATLSVDYISKMNAWFQANRADKKFAADVVNVHLYAFNNNIDWNNPVQKPAETPEDGNMKGKTAALVSYVKTNIPTAEVWVSEFGWDTNPNSILCPKQISGLTINEIQGRWITRAYLAFAAAGVDRAQVFILEDPSQNYVATQYATSGLTDRTLNAARKNSWYYVSTMKNILKNMVFIGEQTQSIDTNVVIYKFKDISSNNGSYVVWSKTSTNYIVSNFNLVINQNAKTAQETALVNGQAFGQQTSLNINNHSVTVQVSESPIFINVDYIK